MKRYEIALFDLDGTLSQSGEGILDCVRQVFAETGKPLPDEQTLSTFIGPPMFDSLRRCGFGEEEAKEGVALYKRHFVEHGIYKNRVYDGIIPVLSRLQAEGVRLGVASTKYQPFTDRIIEMLHLSPYFEAVGGSTALTGAPEGQTPPRHTKIDVMRYVIGALRQRPEDRVVMIGDTKFDADGAAASGCDFIGCLFGYGTKETMAEAYTIGQPLWAASPLDILPLILPEEN